jgi:exopolysaccharide biosynthesis polyprenyl glycosylphosphotransferase
MRNAAGLPLMHVQEPALSRARGPLKKFFDRSASLGLLLLASPVLLLVAFAIKAYDGGPVFFRQARVGALGEEFRMVKFRSMVVDAEARRDGLDGANECDEVLFKIQHDPRVTPVGRLLRRFSLDELPQLFNVLAGQMSLVGPRPALPGEVEGYANDVRRRLLVRPGMTGLWQVSGRSDLSWADSVRLDLYYVDNWSLVGDLVIMGKTVRAVLASQGAY